MYTSCVVESLNVEALVWVREFGMKLILLASYAAVCMDMANFNYCKLRLT